MKFILVIVSTLLLCANAQAQLRKCTGPDGRVTYSDVACATTSKTMQTLDAPPSGARPVPAAAQNPSGNVYERELSGQIAGYLAKNDFDHATTLAVTPEHFQMIQDARQADLERKAAKKATRTVCRTEGTANGISMNTGGINSSSATYSGRTVCRN